MWKVPFPFTGNEKWDVPCLKWTKENNKDSNWDYRYCRKYVAYPTGYNKHTSGPLSYMLPSCKIYEAYVFHDNFFKRELWWADFPPHIGTRWSWSCKMYLELHCLFYFFCFNCLYDIVFILGFWATHCFGSMVGGYTSIYIKSIIIVPYSIIWKLCIVGKLHPNYWFQSTVPGTWNKH